MAFLLVICLLANFVFGFPASFENSKREQTATYDYVVVGCGASGMTVASRLSEREQVSVLCIEAGQLDNREDAILIPYYIGLQPEGFYDWGISSTPQNQLDGASRQLPMGKGVGGGTLINGMVWNRGSRSNYNSWADIGNDGWAWNDILPYFMRSENYTTRDYPEQHFEATKFNRDYHGFMGPVQVSYPQYFWNQSNNWFEALESLGVPTATDANLGLSAGGYFLPLAIDPINQTRSDARTAYYDRAINRSNLNVYTNSPVTRVIFDTKHGLRATGVEYAQGINGTLMTVNVNKEVVLAAGAVHTPQILELSGIGQSSILQQYGIKVLEDLPGVGNNLQDHGMIHLDYGYSNPSIVSVNDFGSNQTFNTECANEYQASKSGPWTAKPSQAVAFPSLQQVTSNATTMLDAASINAESYLPSNYESTLLAGYQQQISSVINELRNDTIPIYENLNNNAGGLDLALMRPLSRGTCHITSTNPFDSPAVNPNWLAHPFDYNVMIAAMQFNQKLLDTPALTPLQPTYPGVPRNANTTVLGNILRAGIGTEFHYSGTAAMLPRELGGVVNSSLIVYGTANVRVVDTSIYPIIPGAHLQSVVYAVAEKAADMMKGLIPGPL